MKKIILLFLIGFSITYDTAAAIRYARTYCKNYNSAYGRYPESPGEDVFFVSQCMIAGGLEFSDCSGASKERGCLTRVTDLKRCLQQKGWKHSTSRPASYKAGYPIFSIGYSHAMLSTSVGGNVIRYCSHKNDRCDASISDNIEYYYE